ncbi:GDSL-type esterase/lipase family protein [Paenibacillus senegalimassiliensis]|uniref:GDSL-type esterase/lipase family protein n=1 Tax=Paenibacillus senegalimassiliensis TaxID=1737426 RepID=UPI000A54D5E5|nr:GDSL-type esterase/lipase family protein [Paenibacillus senegalimassiliensis]
MKRLGILLIAMALVMGACGRQDNGGPANTGQAELPLDYKAQYGTSVFLGDSITEGLSYHDVLNEENVLAGAGKTAEFTMMEDDVDQLIARKPEHVYIHLGSTDILWPTDDPIAHSMTHYGRLIDAIQDGLPEASISLLSVLPVTVEAEEQEPRYATIGEYNEGLQALAEKQQVQYVDLTPLVAEHTDLYDTDGIHFQAAFYPLLLDYLSAPSQ